VSYPLKPPFAGVPAASLYVKLICGPAIGSKLLRPQLSEFLLRLYFLVFFHEARRVPALCY